MRLTAGALLLLLLTPNASDTQTSEHTLDVLAGRWTLHDAAGAVVGDSEVRVEHAGAMLYERRRVGAGAPQSLWFARFEAGGWRQVFVGPQGALRTFDTESPAGRWPIVMGATVTTQDGRATRFRMTMSRVSANEMRRVLESTRDGGGTWQVVFDYTYRRAP